ncbi:ABC transporter ATP-binding protein [Nonomuraea roseoviolacea]|uniref:ATP-binding cassette subfamily B protein/ATP-binding cassette subfamily C protein n=1 Tax=Nonomuraea roseoviolacea subsp. carminata TaxID=160689 RepID=A0ABT1K5N1_9ACTN|nr:ABC transporter ATP-binding protein [Nonomuraea roseoviolacea]MCP2348907.1 ATP-binding cassette subfamily B protein/ATP-binding cassette subfamily C protein [Nonomuraea roseoviolacea subsp. carminata]
MPDEPLELGEVSTADWYAHSDTMNQVGFLTIARRLPSLVRQALAMAWRASPRDTTVTIVLQVLGGVFTAFGLLATTGVLTALFEQGPTPERLRAALPSLALVGAAAALRTAVQAGAGWAQARLGPQISRESEQRLYGLTSSVELVAYDDPDFHDSLQRASSRGVDMADSVVWSAIDVVTAAVGIAAVAGVLGVLHPVLLPLLLLAVLPDAWAAVRGARMRYSTMNSLIPARRRKWIIADLLADRSPAAEVRSFTMRGFLLRMYDAVARAEQEVLLRLARREAMARVAGEALGGLGSGLVYVALGLLLAVGAIPLAVAGTAVLAIRTGQSALAQLMYATNRLYENGLYFTDFLEFCADAERRLTGPRPAAPPEHFERISARDVVFTYPGTDTPALDGVSLEIKRGEVIAFVGENGSGKTTLSKILAGLYEPDSGAVLWDDVDLREVSPGAVRERVTVIAQDHTRWPLTARYNITMGTDRGEPALHAAASVAGAAEVIDELPHGYRTLLDRRFKDGQELSGGQWQRIAVARGFHRDAELLICDEPTAALDARAEHALFERIRDHSEGRTVLLITHRLASVRYADRIYVLDHGAVVESGDHASLMALNGLYAELYTLQATAYRM